MPAPAEKIPVPVAGEIDRDAMEPRCERGIAAKSTESAVCADKRVLRDLLGIGHVTEQAAGDGENLLSITTHNLDKRAFIAAVKASHEFGVVGRLGRGRGT